MPVPAPVWLVAAAWDAVRRKILEPLLGLWARACDKAAATARRQSRGVDVVVGVLQYVLILWGTSQEVILCCIFQVFYLS